MSVVIKGYAGPGNFCCCCTSSIDHEISTSTPGRQVSVSNSGVDLQVLPKSMLCYASPNDGSDQDYLQMYYFFLRVGKLCPATTHLLSMFLKVLCSHDITVKQTVVVRRSLLVTRHVRKWVLSQDGNLIFSYLGE